MRLLTNSRRNCFNTCARKHYYAYELMFKPVKASDALRFGSLWHGALEVWWSKGMEAAITWINEQIETDYNAYELEMVRQLLWGYDRRYQDEQIKVTGVEKEYRAPLINPDSGKESRLWLLAGKIDLNIMLNDRDGIMEHKSTSEDMSPESTYWDNLAIDGQISGYYIGSVRLGYEPMETLYDVALRPQQRPYKATPFEKRKFTKDGNLYANQRASDETVNEFGARIATAIKESPEKYFQRRTVSRIDLDLVEYLFDMWACATAIRAMELASSKRAERPEVCWPRNPRACHTFGECPYFCVCSNVGGLDNPEMFRKVEWPHEELTQNEGEEG